MNIHHIFTLLLSSAVYIKAPDHVLTSHWVEISVSMTFDTTFSF